MVKRLLKALFFVLLLLLLMNYVPVKFAKRITVNNEENTYLCSYTTATDGSWFASVKDNPKLNEDLYLNIYNYESFKRLKEIHNIGKTGLVLNRYVFYGSVYQKRLSDDFDINCIDLKKWDIVYPIQRNSIRALFTPKKYLTVYDFVWKFELCQ